MNNRLCVFVVDDDADHCKSTGLLIRSLGHDAQMFSSAEDLLEALAGCVPDVILSDIGMPSMDGCELARNIRQRSDCSQVVLAAITGHAEEEDRRLAVEAGFDYRFVKPFALHELREFFEQLRMHSR